MKLTPHEISFHAIYHMIETMMEGGLEDGLEGHAWRKYLKRDAVRGSTAVGIIDRVWDGMTPAYRAMMDRMEVTIDRQRGMLKFVHWPSMQALEWFSVGVAGSSNYLAHGGFAESGSLIFIIRALVFTAARYRFFIDNGIKIE